MGASRVVLAAAAAAIAWNALAQPVLRLEPSAASGCLTATDKQQPVPVYPFAEYKFNKPGRVLAELSFGGPALRPVVAVLESSGGDSFVESVKEHARSLRVPCMDTGSEPVALRREYVFKPLSELVEAGPVQDAGEERRRQLLACIRKPGSALPDYPWRAQESGQQGRVIALLSFTAADQAPGVQLLHRPSADEFADAVKPWLTGYRLPCFNPAQDTPLLTALEFVFRLDGDAFGFKPLTLQQFLGKTTNLGLRPLTLDTTGMGCPFNLRLHYRQPMLRNVIYTVGPYMAAREPLLEWLRGAALDLKSGALDSIFGDTADIAVPCIKLDIQPKEKS